ncbi:MAG: 4Fe-4S dicluster domain-containing protein [Bacteroidetes bacterium]|nr:4Fe-4S dicluster domain-containing protein [Bacteroidota bacterium]
MEEEKKERRRFLKFGFLAAALTAAGVGLNKITSGEKNSGENVKLLSTGGELVEVDKKHVKTPHCGASSSESRKGIPDRKFVMVIDLSRCKNARKCVQGCQKAHDLPPEKEWIKVHRMQDSEETAPYWFPKPCYHCGKPACVKVCPVEATFKRSDGIVLIDQDRCIGCKYCMIACPYAVRSFNWHKQEPDEGQPNNSYSPETGTPAKPGSVGKCDFCPDLIREGKLPHCVTACPMGVIYFGDYYEDAVTNGTETLRFSDLMRDRGGYRFLEHFGTKPSVYYLPPVNRQFPFKEETENA